jgi:hypothetical protein
VNNKIIINLVAILSAVLFFATSDAGSERYSKKGYIQNDNGDKCWYKQTTDTANTYFYETLEGTVGNIIFDDPQCMSDKGLGMDVNKMMINNTISRWYSLSNAKFQTRVSEMYNGSPMQKKGKCIQSKTYFSTGITVDYIIKNKSIIQVIHGVSIQGCQN